MAEFTESFDQADSTTLGPDLTWTEVEGDIETVGNRVRVVDRGVASTARAEHDVDTDDHIAEIDLVTAVIDPLSTTNIAVVLCRMPNAAERTGYGLRRLDVQATSDQHRLERVENGTTTVLSGPTDEAIATPETLASEANGSTIRGLINDVEKHSVTDTEITGNTRGGMLMFVSGVAGAADDMELDNFRIADLSESASGTALVAGGGTITASATTGRSDSGTIAGGGTLSASATANRSSALTLSGGGALLAVATASRSGVALLGGGGTITASGEGSGSEPPVTAFMSPLTYHLRNRR